MGSGDSQRTSLLVWGHSAAKVEQDQVAFLWSRRPWWWYWQSPERTLLALFGTFLFLTFTIGHDYYKIYAWPTAEAVVESIEWECIYAKKRIFLPTLRDYVKCDAKEDAAKLIADGYKYDGRAENIWVVYQPEAGGRIRGMIDEWPPEAGWSLPAVGSSIRVRYSPSAPETIEYATQPGRKGLVIVIMILGLVAVSFVALPLLGQRDDL